MKLSEAIRLGAMLKPQSFGLSESIPDGTCALQAANEAIANRIGDFYGCIGSFPILRDRPQCPVCGVEDEMHWIIAMHLNDKYRWTRERIADWVTQFESKESTSTIEQPQHQEAAP